MAASVIDFEAVRTARATRSLKRTVRLALLREDRPRWRKCYEHLLRDEFQEAAAALGKHFHKKPKPAKPSLLSELWLLIKNPLRREGGKGKSQA